MEMDLKALKDTPPWEWPAGTIGSQTMTTKLTLIVQ
jgi:hypothetical protein